MKRSVCCVAVIATAFASAPVEGLVRPSVAQPRQEQAPAIADLKAAVLEAMVHQNERVDLRMTRHLLTVILVNSKLASDRVFFREFATEREAEAAQIASKATEKIASNPQFGAIQAIRIEYVGHDKAGRSQILDVIEFRKNPQGQFLHHRT